MLRIAGVADATPATARRAPQRRGVIDPADEHDPPPISKRRRPADPAAHGRDAHRSS